MQGRKAQTSNQVMRYSIGILVTAIVVAQVAIPVVTDSLAIQRNSVTNETVSSSGSLPEVLALAEDESGIENGSVTVYLKDSLDDQVFKLDSANYTVIPDDPDRDDFLNVTGPFTRANDSGDQYNVSYNGEPEGFIESAAARSILGFVALMLAVAFLVVAFRPVTRFAAR